MLLFDLSGIVTHTCINLHNEGEDVNLDAVRHVAMSSLLYYKKRFSKKFGNPVICVDSRPYWREAIHKHYKKNRKKARDDSTIDWELFSHNFKLVRADIQEYCPYPYIAPPRTEADDSIAILTQYAYARRDPVMIVSSDKDMIQLQDKYKGVQQYSPRVKRMLTAKDADYGLLEHILRGDRSDGIPNVLSADNHFMIEDAPTQKRVTKKIVEAARQFDDPADYFEDADRKHRVKQNRMLIDLNYIPDRIADNIISAYEDELAKNKRNRMMTCVKKYRMRNLLQSVQDF